MSEFDDLMHEALNGDAAVTSEIGRRVRELLERAAHVGRPWADAMLERALDRGCQQLGKDWIRKQHTSVFRAFDGRSLEKPAMAGLAVRDAESGEKVHEQRLFEELSWAELAEHRAAVLANRESLSIRIDAVDRLLALKRQFPDTFGPAEACERAGVTIREVLGGVAEAS